MSSVKLSDSFREPCEDEWCPDKDQRTLYCVHCDCSFCDTCWGKQPAHKPNKRGTDGHAHERIDRLVVERYRNILEPSSSTQEQESLHKDDEDTTWFGIGRNRADDPISEDYGRYSTLIADSLPLTPRIRYPQLVSFIGQTGNPGLPVSCHYVNQTQGPVKAPSSRCFSKDDTIGCGIDMETRQLFFTKSGVNLGVALANVRGMLFAMIAFGERESKIRVKLGESKFVYAIGAHDWAEEDVAAVVRFRTVTFFAQ